MENHSVFCAGSTGASFFAVGIINPFVMFILYLENCQTLIDSCT